MAGTQTLKRRIKSAKNIKQITKAMEMVAASKMRRSQQQALSSRPYSRKLQATLNTISLLTSNYSHPLLTHNQTGNDIILLVSTDKSLAGGLNTNLFRGALKYLQEHQLAQAKLITVGQKARQFVSMSGMSLMAEFANLPDPLSYADTLPLSSMIQQGFTNQEFRSVHIIYMDFISTLVQQVRAWQFLPFSTNWEDVIDTPKEALDAVRPDHTTYLFEPSAKEILDWLLPYYLELTIYQVLVESRASEHSARMVAMKNASDNATDIIADLTLSYNKVRQSNITSELLDNTTASMIMK